MPPIAKEPNPEFFPSCHACGSAEQPFALTTAGLHWRHRCGAVVCPACGAAPMTDDALCITCRRLVIARRAALQRISGRYRLVRSA